MNRLAALFGWTLLAVGLLQLVAWLPTEVRQIAQMVRANGPVAEWRLLLQLLFNTLQMVSMGFVVLIVLKAHGRPISPFSRGRI